jgi:hypothetical protein
MARMREALWRPIPASTTRITSYDILCWHTAVGSLWGTDAYFRQIAPGVNSHFGVGHDGTIVQWVDTAYRSGANLNGNHHIISVETADVGTGFPAWNTNDGSAVPAWTPAQVEANAKIAAWVNKTHGIERHREGLSRQPSHRSDPADHRPRQADRVRRRGLHGKHERPGEGRPDGVRPGVPARQGWP